MPETFERGKKYQVIKKWSTDVDPRLRSQQVRYSINVGEQLRFRGPNFTGAEFLDAEGKLVILPIKVAFRIMGQLNTGVEPTQSRRRQNSKGANSENFR